MFNFFDEFLVNVFLPQLEDTVLDLFNSSVHELDAFEQDPGWQTISRSPIQKIALSFYRLIGGLCHILNIIPSTRDEYRQLIISMLAKCYQRYYDYYQELVTKQKLAADDNELELTRKTSAIWAQHSSQISYRIWSGEDNMKNLSEETAMQMKLVPPNRLQENDLILDEKGWTALSLLYSTLQWFVGKMYSLRHVHDSEMEDSGRMDQGAIAVWLFVVSVLNFSNG